MAARLPSRAWVVFCMIALQCIIGCDRGSPDTQREPERVALPEPVAPSGSSPAATARLSQTSLPLSFIENKGQLDAAVKYVLRGPRGSVFFTPTEVVFEVFRHSTIETEPHVPEQAAPEKSAQRRSVVVRVSFPGAQHEVTVEGRRELPGKVNVLRGSDPTKWHTDIRTVAEILYRDLYRGINLIFSSTEGQLTRIFILGSDGDIRNVRMKYAGVESVQLTNDGAIRLNTAIGTIMEQAPTAQRLIDNTTVPLRIEPHLTGPLELSFAPSPN